MRKKMLGIIAGIGLACLTGCNGLEVGSGGVVSKVPLPLKEICSQKNQKLLDKYGFDLKCKFTGKDKANIILSNQGRVPGEMELECTDRAGHSYCRVVKNTLL